MSTPLACTDWQPHYTKYLEEEGVFQLLGVAIATKNFGSPNDIKIKKGEEYALFYHAGSAKEMQMELGLAPGKGSGTLAQRLATQRNSKSGDKVACRSPTATLSSPRPFSMLPYTLTPYHPIP